MCALFNTFSLHLNPVIVTLQFQFHVTVSHIGQICPPLYTKLCTNFCRLSKEIRRVFIGTKNFSNKSCRQNCTPVLSQVYVFHTSSYGEKGIKKTDKIGNVRITSHCGGFAQFLYLLGYPNSLIPFHLKRTLL